MVSENSEGQASACIRQSGQLDLYWNYKLLCSTDAEAKVDEELENGQIQTTVTKYANIRMNFDEIKFRRHTEILLDGQMQKSSSKLLSIELDHRYHISLDCAQKTKDKNIFFKN